MSSNKGGKKKGKGSESKAASASEPTTATTTSSNTTASATITSTAPIVSASATTAPSTTTTVEVVAPPQDPHRKPQEDKSNIYVIIMAGGIGSRFWPASRNETPKQFLDILGTGKTLIQLTFDRLLPICEPQNIYIVTNARYKGVIKEQLPEISDSQILCEPVGKNTAPCIAFGAYKIFSINPNASIIVAASDHMIQKEGVYHQTLKRALEYVAHHDQLVTLGMRPTRPDTGYGYIQFGEEEPEHNQIYRVKTFTEKPSRELAEQFIRSGDYLWNSGMFIWTAKTIIKAFETYLPEVHEPFWNNLRSFGTSEEPGLIAMAYEASPNISIDFAVMEKAENVRVIPSSFGWSDIGTWVSLYELRSSSHDYYGNAVTGHNVLTYDAYNNMISIPKDKLVIIQGLRDYIVVDTKDALLICEKSKEQKIKDFTAEVRKRKGGDQFL